MKNRRLVMQILGEVEPRPAGLVLPGGKVVKRFDSNRIERVIWKIVRGLFFHHHGKTLPQKLKLTWTFTGPDDGPPPEHFQNFTPNHSSYGKYPGVFAYQFDAFRNLLTSGIPRAQRSLAIRFFRLGYEISHFRCGNRLMADPMMASGMPFAVSAK